MNQFKLSTEASTSYFGGKSGSGTYQKIINEIPKHDVFVSGFLGHCGILRHKKPARVNIGFELNTKVINDWCPHDKLTICEESFMNSAWVGSYVKPNSKIFMYLDPPYLLQSRKSDRKVYKYEMTEEQHVELLQYILKLRCDIAISTYPNDLYAQYLSDWRVKSFVVGTRRGAATELLYMNYSEPKELHDYSYLGETFRQREQIKRKHRSLTTKIAMLQPLERSYLFNSLKETYKI